MAQVLLENVVKVYPNGFRAVAGVDLAIHDREFVVLVGPSGCGKTTTLRMVAGLEEISSGTIRIGERVVNGVAPKDRDIAMVFQNYALYPHMSVYENMAFSLQLRRRHSPWQNPVAWLLSAERRAQARNEAAAIDARVRAAAGMLGIEHLLQRKPRELSGGQRQRVAVGRAIVREPAAFLFDEPLSNLDAKLRVEMRAEIKRLHRRVQTTTIYVTHDQEEAMTLGDRVVVMKDGVIHQMGAPFEVYEHPVNRFVAGFLGTPPMNFLRGTLRAAGDGLQIDVGDGRLAVSRAHAESLAGHVGSDLILGIRPDGLRRVSGPDSGARLRLATGVVEPLGDRQDVHLHSRFHERLVCRLDARPPVRENEPIELDVDMQRVHYFTPEGDGANLVLQRRVADASQLAGAAS